MDLFADIGFTVVFTSCSYLLYSSVREDYRKGFATKFEYVAAILVSIFIFGTCAAVVWLT